MEDPEEDVAENNPELPATFPTPKVDLPGYETVGGPSDCIWFKAPDQQPCEIEEQQRKFDSIIELEAEEAQALLIDHANKQSSCFGPSGLKSLQVTSIDRCLAWHYRLESFVEERAACWTYEPYLPGRVLEQLDTKKVADPWSLQLEPNRMFQSHEKQAVVPHTSVVQPCHQCLGQRVVTCWKCRGRAMLKCHVCHGSGKRTVAHGGLVSKAMCRACNGVGRKRCSLCHAMATLPCPTCKGQGDLVFSIRLRSHWRVQDSDRLEENTELPLSLIRTVKGHTILEEEGDMVSSVKNFIDEKVDKVSQELIACHLQLKTGKILRQRQTLRVVPIFKCAYTCNGSVSGDFMVYGFEKKVFTSHSFSSCTLL